MKRILTCLLLLLLLTCEIRDCNAGEFYDRIIAPPDYVGSVSLSIEVYDIIPQTKEAEIIITATLVDFPFNASTISVPVFGGSGGYSSEANVSLYYDIFLDGYSGESDITKWYLLGAGDYFPYDNYELEFYLPPIFSYVSNESTSVLVYGGFRDLDITFELKISDTFAMLEGDKIETLSREWKETDAGYLPLHEHEKGRIRVQLSRKPLISFIEFILPIIACYFLLGASFFISRNKLSNRLRVYITIFILNSYSQI